MSKKRNVVPLARPKSATNQYLPHQSARFGIGSNGPLLSSQHNQKRKPMKPKPKVKKAIDFSLLLAFGTQVVMLMRAIIEHFNK